MYAYVEDDFSKEAVCARKLLDHIKKSGYTIAGDYICEVVIDFPVMEEEKRKMFSKMQIPVTLS